MVVKGKRQKVAWGITGSGEKIMETVEIMEKMKKSTEKRMILEFSFPKRVIKF